jgi:hypothetical protein
MSSPIPPLTDAELAALEEAFRLAANEDDGPYGPSWTIHCYGRRLIAEVRAAREAAARREAEAERRRAVLDEISC